jgi:hypothetical protein
MLSRNVGDPIPSDAVLFPRRKVRRNQRNWLKQEPRNGIGYVDFLYRPAKGRRISHGFFTCAFSWAAAEMRVPENNASALNRLPSLLQHKHSNTGGRRTLILSGVAYRLQTCNPSARRNTKQTPTSGMAIGNTPTCGLLPDGSVLNDFPCCILS